MSILDGVQNFLQLLNDNWTTIFIIVALIISIVKKTVDLFKESDDNKISVAKKQIQETILKLIADAEVEYEEWVKAGGIKRSKVIKEIFEKYPILSKVSNQDELIDWLDNLIDDALNTLRKIVAQNKEK